MNFNLNYLSSGAGRPVIFQHGLGADATQAQALLGGMEGVQLISLDCPGHGKSPLPASYAPSFAAYTAEVLRLMDHLGIEKAVLGGISMGSGISLRMAIHHPERVAGLILVRPAWLAQGRPANLEILLELIPYLAWPDGEAQFARTETFRQIRAELQQAAASVAGMFSREQGDATARVVTHLVADAPFADMASLAGIQQPALLVGNADDPLHPLEIAEEIATHLPNRQLKTVTSRYLDGAKHRQEVLAHVRSFLEI